MDYLNCLEIEPATPPNSAIIWLHGLGADGNDFAPLAPQLKLPEGAVVRFVFPHAPSMPVTINHGYVMPAWYDILEDAIDRKVDEAQLCASAASIADLIDREIERGIDSTRILIAGFSQGGAVAYQTALSFPKPLAGLIILSSYFATSGSIEEHPANKDIPVLIQHGTRDPIVPEALGKQAHRLLNQRGYKTIYQSYPMEHSVCMEEVADIGDWLQDKL
jgi:phospholipase/carboxylesterase